MRNKLLREFDKKISKSSKFEYFEYVILKKEGEKNTKGDLIYVYKLLPEEVLPQ